MAAIALIKFTQATPGDPGEAYLGTTGTLVLIENSSNTDVVSWAIELLYVEPNSSLGPIDPEFPVILAQANNNNPQASFTPDVAGSYRIRLTVFDAISQVDVDIRNFTVPLANGTILMPYQDLPKPLPVKGSGEAGEKPNEMNLDGQKYGWSGDVTHRLMNQTLVQLDGLLGGSITDQYVKASTTDTTPGPLNAKLGLGLGLGFSLQNPAANEQLKLSLPSIENALVELPTPLTLTRILANYPSPPETDGVHVWYGNGGGLDNYVIGDPNGYVRLLVNEYDGLNPIGFSEYKDNISPYSGYVTPCIAFEPTQNQMLMIQYFSDTPYISTLSRDIPAVQGPLIQISDSSNAYKRLLIGEGYVWSYSSSSGRITKMLASDLSIQTSSDHGDYSYYSTGTATYDFIHRFSSEGRAYFVTADFSIINRIVPSTDIVDASGTPGGPVFALDIGVPGKLWAAWIKSGSHTVSVLDNTSMTELYGLNIGSYFSSASEILKITIDPDMTNRAFVIGKSINLQTRIMLLEDTGFSITIIDNYEDVVSQMTTSWVAAFGMTLLGNYLYFTHNFYLNSSTYGIRRTLRSNLSAVEDARVCSASWEEPQYKIKTGRYDETAGFLIDKIQGSSGLQVTETDALSNYLTISSDAAVLQQFIWNYNNTSIGVTPTSGKFKTNSTSPSTFTEIRFSNSSVGSSAVSLTSILDYIGEGDRILLRSSRGNAFTLVEVIDRLSLNSNQFTIRVLSSNASAFAIENSDWFVYFFKNRSGRRGGINVAPGLYPNFGNSLNFRYSDIHFIDANGVGDVTIQGMNRGTTDAGLFFKTLYNDAELTEPGHTVTLVHNSTSATGSRIICPGGINIKLFPKESVDVYYHEFFNQWRVIRKTAADTSGVISITATPSASQNNWNPTGWGTATYVRVDRTSNSTITGASATASATTKKLVNVNIYNVTITNNDAASTAGNRFIIPGGGSLVLAPNDVVDITYDSTSACWRVG